MSYGDRKLGKYSSILLLTMEALSHSTQARSRVGVVRNKDYGHCFLSIFNGGFVASTSIVRETLR